MLVDYHLDSLFICKPRDCSQTLDRTDSLGGQTSVWNPHVQVPVMLSLGVASSSVQSANLTANLRSCCPHQILCSSGNAGFQGSFHLDPWSCLERAGLWCLAIVRCVYKGKGFGLVVRSLNPTSLRSQRHWVKHRKAAWQNFMAYWQSCILCPHWVGYA